MKHNEYYSLRQTCYDCLWRGDCEDKKAGMFTGHTCKYWEYRYS